MTKKQSPKQYDLEERTLNFARSVFLFCKKLPKSAIEGEIARQLVRAATSVGANYIEANEALGKKDFLMRIRICRKEAKESRYWLELVDTNDALDRESERKYLGKEATELMNIFGAILRKTE